VTERRRSVMARPCESRRRVGVWVARSAGDGKSVAMGRVPFSNRPEVARLRKVRAGRYLQGSKKPACCQYSEGHRQSPNGRAAMPEPEISSKFCSPERV